MSRTSLCALGLALVITLTISGGKRHLSPNWFCSARKARVHRSQHRRRRHFLFGVL
jgi:hypothetical protein